MFRKAALWSAVGIAGVSALIACNQLRVGIPDDDDGSMDDAGVAPTEKVGTISVTPTPTDITIDGTAQVLKFQARSSRLGDITQRANWSLSDGSIGSINKGTLTVGSSLTRGGSYKVVATLGDGSGAAVVNIKLIAPDVVDPSAPADAKDWFGGTPGGPAPQVVYPFNNTMMAPNILQLGVQWQAGSGQTVYRLRVSGPTYERNFYVGSRICSGSQCTFPVPDMLWSDLGHSSLEQQVTMTVSGAGSKGGPVGVSSDVKITFSPEDVRGGLYYFSPTIEGIKRVPLGASKPVDFIRNGDETGCAGCHAVSRDGKQVAVEFGSGQTGTGSTVVDGANPKMRNWPLQPGIAWNFAWFNPGADLLLTNWSGQLIIRDPKNGRAVSTVPQGQIGGAGAAMPEWSPDGNYFAFVREPSRQTYDFEMQNCGDIMIMPYNAGSFGAAVELVHGQPSSEVHFWPSWSPDSKWLVFNSMTCSGGSCGQYDAVSTRLRLIRARDDAGNPVTGQKPIELVQGTHQPNQTNNWPKFAPFIQKDRYMFVVYSAKYSWGFGGGNPQLFMFGLDLDQAKMGADPSFQPIWLPFQEPSTGNHSAIWTTDVVCNRDADCPGEFTCQSNMCVPRIG